jgi:hypothetical protein
MFSVRLRFLAVPIPTTSIWLIHAHRLHARLLIPLNKCRHKTLYAPWKCEDERYVGKSCPSR